jgi:hypothetical protein
MVAPNDPRVSGLVLLNPWSRPPEGEAKAYVHHYDVRGLLRRRFWLK